MNADPVALEIHRKFWAKMEPKGEIDKILAGGVNAPKIEPLPDAEIEILKRQIAVQMAEYEQAIMDAIAWQRGWKNSQPKGFKALRR